MRIVCLDLEGVLVPEIWIAFAEKTGVDELTRTTRDEPDYEVLMRYRLEILNKHGFSLSQIQDVIETLDPLPGALDFLDELRLKYELIILSDTFREFAGPLMKKLNFPTLFCHELKVNNDHIEDIKLRHPDHKRASELVSTACFLSGLTKIDTNQKAWRPNAIYHYIQFQELKPDFVVDITDFIEVKKEAVLSYESQFYNPKSKEPETIISSKSFLESVIYRAENLGRLSGVKYAEGFTVEKLVAVDSLDDIK